MKPNQHYWIYYKEDPRKEVKIAQYVHGEMYIPGHKNAIPLELIELADRVKLANNMKTVYIAGPYRWRGNRFVPKIIGEIINIYRAWKIARDVWVAGFAAVCPHTNGLLMDRFGGTPEMFLQGDLDILRQCDCILMTPEWETSSGAIAERNFALELGIPVFHSIETLKESH